MCICDIFLYIYFFKVCLTPPYLALLAANSADDRLDILASDMKIKKLSLLGAPLDFEAMHRRQLRQEKRGIL
jgi:hypothetical protein